MAKKPKWAVQLAGSLKRWSEENGYQYLNSLAEELQILPTTWKHMAAGDMIANDVTIYARIYLRTGLPEADPRSIPPRLNFDVKEKKYSEIPRAWSEEQYQIWLSGQGKRETGGKENPTLQTVSEKSVTKRPKTQGSTPKPMIAVEPKVELTPGRMVDNLIEALGREIGRSVAEELKGILLPRQPETGVSGGITSQADALLKGLNLYLNGTPADRDQLTAKHGKVLGPLYVALKLLVLSGGEREKAIEEQKRLGGIFR